MGDGPYSGEKFIKAWNFGNVYSTHNALKREPGKTIASMPSAVLRATWEHNSQRAARARQLGGRCDVPKIHFLSIDGRLCRGVIWPRAASILLPRVDYVALAEVASGKPLFALASWSEVVDVVQRAGFDTTRDPIHLDYIVIPPAIKQWFIDKNPAAPALPAKVDSYRIVDEEVVAAARASFEENGTLVLQRPEVQGLGW